MERVPSALTLVPFSVTVLSSVAYTTSITRAQDSSVQLTLHIEVLPLGEEVVLTYLATPNSENTDEGMILLEPVQLTYSTIRQNGIGLRVSD